MTIYTQNFHPESDPKLLCTCNHPDCDKRSVSQETLNRAQIARGNYGKPLMVTSGGRCPNHPNEVHRTKPADHQKCQALDIACSGANRGDIMKAGLDAGFNAIGVAKTFIHWGYRPELPEGKIVVWTY